MKTERMSACPAVLDRPAADEMPAPVLRIDNLLAAEACAELISKAQSGPWDPASVSDDEPPTRWVKGIRIDTDGLTRGVRAHVPGERSGAPFWGIAERLLIIRYLEGDRFPMHTDAPLATVPGLLSAYTLIVYLNDDFEGGQTYFPDIDLTVTPKRGAALIFSHDMRHEGKAITSGTKYAIHGFLMYEHSRPGP